MTNQLSKAGALHWPEHSQNIDHAALNGEIEEVIYEIGKVLYRKNPSGGYALVWTGRKWIESSSVKNDWLKSNDGI